MEFNLEDICFALTDALDFVGTTHKNHGKRVSYLATEIGRHLGWSDAMLRDLGMAAILHDVGLSSTREYKTITSKMEMEGASVHCERGWLLMSSFYLFSNLAPLVLHHHTPWERLIHIDLPGKETAWMSNLIFLADRIDILSSRKPELTLLAHTESIRKDVDIRTGSLFSPELVKAFLALSLHEGFWLYLDEKYVESRLRPRISRASESLDLPQVKQLAKLFAKVVDSKSRFTAEHSLGVGRLSRLLGVFSSLPERQCDLIEVAGYLHDIGKLRVPDEILDKPGSLSEEERAVIRRHPFDTYQILNSVRGFWGISEWAAFHHETPKGSGYPFGIGNPLLCLEAKIIAVADIFQALTQERPYRSTIPMNRVIEIMDEMCHKHLLDRPMFGLLCSKLDECLVAAKG